MYTRTESSEWTWFFLVSIEHYRENYEKDLAGLRQPARAGTRIRRPWPQRYYVYWIECETNVFSLSSVFIVLILLLRVLIFYVIAMWAVLYCLKIGYSIVYLTVINFSWIYFFFFIMPSRQHDLTANTSFMPSNRRQEVKLSEKDVTSDELTWKTWWRMWRTCRYLEKDGWLPICKIWLGKPLKGHKKVNWLKKCLLF